MCVGVCGCVLPAAGGEAVTAGYQVSLGSITVDGRLFGQAFSPQGNKKIVTSPPLQDIFSILVTWYKSHGKSVHGMFHILAFFSFLKYLLLVDISIFFCHFTKSQKAVIIESMDSIIETYLVRHFSEAANVSGQVRISLHAPFPSQVVGKLLWSWLHSEVEESAEVEWFVKGGLATTSSSNLWWRTSQKSALAPGSVIFTFHVTFSWCSQRFFCCFRQQDILFVLHFNVFSEIYRFIYK